jgi:flavoprotein
VTATSDYREVVTKKCRTCEQTLSIDEFPRAKAMKNGRINDCSGCKKTAQAAYVAAVRQLKHEYQHEFWLLENIERHKRGLPAKDVDSRRDCRSA